MMEGKEGFGVIELEERKKGRRTREIKERGGEGESSISNIIQSDTLDMPLI